MKYILDTNILLHVIRENSIIETDLNRLGVYQPRASSISIVSVGELLSISKRNNWGSHKMTSFENLERRFRPIPIQSRELLEAYAEIDTYSLGKLASNPLPRGMTSRVMGKNDLWIAATTFLTKTSLVTTDNDFDHLDGVYFSVIKLSPTLTSKTNSH
jgi:tRNA(fMet)-specific endonuclease VapC